GDVVVGRALAAAHARLGRLGGHDLVREDADPHLAAPLEVVGDGAAGRLDLARGDPTRIQRLDGELAEGDRVAAGGDAAHPATVLLAVLEALGLQHATAPRLRRPAAARRAPAP